MQLGGGILERCILEGGSLEGGSLVGGILEGGIPSRFPGPPESGPKHRRALFAGPLQFEEGSIEGGSLVGGSLEGGSFEQGSLEGGGSASTDCPLICRGGPCPLQIGRGELGLYSSTDCPLIYLWRALSSTDSPLICRGELGLYRFSVFSQSRTPPPS